MSKEFPGGDPGNVMTNGEGRAIGLATSDGMKLKEPTEYSEDDKKWLNAVVTRRGIDTYTQEERAYIEAVLGEAPSTL